MAEKETKQCQNCESDFVIEPEDFDFYKKIDVPPPTWCPDCRLIRRLVWRNERALYKRKCDLCDKDIISMYPADAPHPVYCRSCWYSDKWDPLEYGREYDFSKPFFEQFRELMDVVPQIALQVSDSINSDYANQVANCKNCYLVSSGSDNEDCMYSFRIFNSRSVLDGIVVGRCEFCYEGRQVLDSSGLVFADLCTDDLECSFVYDVRSSNNCFMSSNLRHASYVFRNEKLSKEDYQEKIKNEVDTGSYQKFESYKEELKKLKKTSLHKYVSEKNAIDSSGDSMANVKGCKQCFWVSDSEDLSYCLMVNDAKDTHDVNNGCCVMELNYEVSTMGVNAFNVRLSADIWPEARNVTYSQSCRNNVSDLFGCVAIRKKKYCILNKQYSEEEYKLLLPKIREHMSEMPYTDKNGRVYKFGEFFPPELSLYAYNESAARDFFPKTKEDAKALGARWREEERAEYEPSISAFELPDNIKDASDDVLKEVIGCLHERECNHYCTGAFKVTPDELRFYKKTTLPLPRLCPNCRHYERLESRNPFKLWHRQCMCDYEIHKNSTRHQHHPEGRCPNEFQTSYAPDRPEIIYCESCYQAEIV